VLFPVARENNINIARSFLSDRSITDTGLLLHGDNEVIADKVESAEYRLITFLTFRDYYIILSKWRTSRRGRGLFSYKKSVRTFSCRLYTIDKRSRSIIFLYFIRVYSISLGGDIKSKAPWQPRNL